MATSLERTVDHGILARTGAMVAGCTAVLTAAFVGALSLLGGHAVGAGSRLQFYVLAGAVTFVGSLLVLEESRHDAQRAISGSVIAGAAGLLFVGLATEGVLYTLAKPRTVLSSSRFVYLTAAALLVSGLGYWSIRNWKLFGRRLPSDGL